jgi:hypothetical protein
MTSNGGNRREGWPWAGLQLSVCEEADEEEDGQSGDGARAALWLHHLSCRSSGGDDGFLVHGNERVK